MVESLEAIIAGHAFFSGLEDRYLQSLTGCATNLRFDAGAYLFREGESTDHFYLIRQGKVAIEISAPPRKPIIVQSLSDGDVLGWSWLVPPYQWRFLPVLSNRFGRSRSMANACGRDAKKITTWAMSC